MKSHSKHFFLFFFFLLKYFILLILSLDSTTNVLEPYTPHNSDLLVSHYDCSKQHNLRHFSLTRVKPCAQASSWESTRAIANVFVRAKAERLIARTYEVYVTRENVVCAQSDDKYCRHDRTDYHQNTLERPRTSDHAESKHAILHLIVTDNSQLNAYE